jgi:hypothetical protein
MLELGDVNIDNPEEFFKALSLKSSEYIRDVFQSHHVKSKLPADIGSLKRIIVHIDPHIDEYLGQLIFRGCLPSELDASLTFHEQIIYIDDDDTECQDLWPAGAVFGIGEVVSGGATPMLLFDEHLADNKAEREFLSCADVVAKKLLNSIPESICKLIFEINAIDAYGRAHPQHLGNILKNVHQATLIVEKDLLSLNHNKMMFSVNIKKGLFDACIAAVVYCMECDMDLRFESKDMKEIANVFMRESLDRFLETCLYKEHELYDTIVKRFKYMTENQYNVLRSQAFLKDRKGKYVVKDEKCHPQSSGTSKKPGEPQLLILSRVIRACEYCWGRKVTNDIFKYIWESEFITSLIYFTNYSALLKTSDSIEKQYSCPFGELHREKAPPIKIKRNEKRPQKKGPPLWIQKESMEPIVVLEIELNEDALRVKEAALSYIRKQYNGCGILFLTVAVGGYKSIFKGHSIPDDKWKDLVSLIMNREKGLWHDASRDPDKPAPFLLNGNRANRHIPNSPLTTSLLLELIKETFYG